MADTKGDTIGTPALRAEFDGSALEKGSKRSTDRVKATFEESNRSVEKIQREASRRIQSLVSQINAEKPRRQMFELSQAIQHVGGVSALSEGQVSRLRAQVERLVAAGAKAPKSLAALVAPMQGPQLPGAMSRMGAAAGQQLTGQLANAAPGGMAGILGAVGPAGLAAAAGIGAATIAAAKAAQAVGDLAERAEKWKNVSDSTQIDVTSIQQLERVAKDAGFSLDDVTKMVGEMQSEIATGSPQVKKFGVDLSDLKGAAPIRQLEETARRIMSIEDPAMRATAAQAAFGKTGRQLIPILEEVSSGAYRTRTALGEQQVDALLKVDAALDKVGGSWEAFTNQLVASAISGGKGADGVNQLARALDGVTAILAKPVPGQGTIGGMLMKGFLSGASLGGSDALSLLIGALGGGDTAGEAIDASNRAKAGAAKFNALTAPVVSVPTTTLADDLKASFAATEATIAVNKKLAEEAKAIADKLAAARRKELDAELALLKARDDAAKSAEARAAAAAGGSFAAEDRAAAAERAKYLQGFDVDAARQARYGQGVRNAESASARGIGVETIRAGLEGMGLSAEEATGIIDLHVKKQKEATKETFKFSQQLADFAHTLQMMPGPLGKVGGLLAGIAGGASGFGAGKDALKKAKELTGSDGLLAKVGAYGQIAASALAIGSSVVGGLKSIFGAGKLKKEAAEAGKLLGQTVTTEQLKAYKEEAKAAGKSLQQFLRDKKAEEDKAKRQAAAQEKDAARQQLESGLAQAKAGVEAMQQALDKGKFSDAIKEAFGRIADEVRQALLKAGMGYALDERLTNSAAFQGAQGLAGGAAQAMSGMRQAGMVSAGLMGAGGTIAKETMTAAVEAAKAAGLSDTEAQQAGFGAISDLLREQLNASIASGRELDSNTAELIAQAKANGIDIIADPMVESVATEKKMLAELEKMNGSRPSSGKVSPDGDGSGDVVSAASGLRPVRASMPGIVNYHPNELVSKNGKAFLTRREGLMPFAAGDTLFVLPSQMFRGNLISAAGGLFDRAGDRSGGDDGRTGGDRAGGGITGIIDGGSSSASGPTIAEIVETAVSKMKPSITIQFAPQITVGEDIYASHERREDAARAAVDAVKKQLRAREAELVYLVRQVS